MDSAAVVLSVAGVTWQVGGSTILRDVDLDVRRGEFLSLIGPNGAGKSSLVNILSGAVRPTGGSITFEGKDITTSPTWTRIRMGMGRSFQTSSVFPALTAFENVRLAAQAKRGRSLSLLTRPRSSDEASTAAQESLERVGLAEAAGQRADSLSHADKRKLEIALIHVQKPTLLLLDEPTAGAAAEEVDRMVDLIRDLHVGGSTIVMVEHRMELVAAVSDRIAVMHQGSLLLVDTPSVVLADPTVRRAYLGEEVA